MPRLHAVFGGDLRGVLKALDEGVEDCIGMQPPAAVPAGGPAVVPPVRYDDLTTTLQPRYAALLEAELDELRIERLRRWAEAAGTGVRTQRQLQELWELSQGPVSTTVGELVAAGYVTALPRRGLEPIEYVLAGPTRIAFGLV